MPYKVNKYVNTTQDQITDTVCRLTEGPCQWSNKVNDQCVVTGWAGYDENTRYLPPEHYFAHQLREAVITSYREGDLAGQGRHFFDTKFLWNGLTD